MDDQGPNTFVEYGPNIPVFVERVKVIRRGSAAHLLFACETPSDSETHNVVQARLVVPLDKLADMGLAIVAAARKTASGSDTASERSAIMN